MMTHWWKILALLLLGYSLVAGMLIPLKPGILSIDQTTADAGSQVRLTVTGYNTSFSDAESLRVWLKFDDRFAVSGDIVEVVGPRTVVLDFTIPGVFPYRPDALDLSLVIDHPVDGAFVMPGALFIRPSSVTEIDESAGAEAWNGQISNLHDRQGISFPFRSILYETIRNTFYHVPLWFAMIALLAASMGHSVKYLRGFDAHHDRRAAALAQVGLLFGILGLVTGAIWANYSWGKPWSNDIKQLVSAIALLIYLAYFVLRMAFDSPEQRARVSAVFNIFAFAALIPLLFVIPRLNAIDSLHPGNAGNPGFGGEDLDNTMRLVFYPAIIGWILLGLWMAGLSARYFAVRDRLLDEGELND
jgi:heme exporter protein C